LTGVIGRLPDLGVPILNAFITNIPNQKMPDDQPDRQIAGTRGAVLMMPVAPSRVDQQLAGSQKAVLNAFVTNIPIQMMPVYLPDRPVAGSWYAVLMTPVELPDRQIAGSWYAVLIMLVELPDRQLAGSRYAVLDAFVTYLSAGGPDCAGKLQNNL
jgi:hypothetical protein